MPDTIRKLTWKERVLQTEEYHKKQLKLDSKWTIRDTAREMNRSYGAISEDLNAASFLKTYPKIEGFKSFADVMTFIRAKKLELRLK